MTTQPEVVEGDYREAAVDQALAVIPPVGLAVADSPEGMIALAARMATALKDIVERQHLYAVISGKKFPQVEAWMTIGRMDNVVARESRLPIRHDDGAYEAEVELVRLSDGMVIGRASALCGSPGDKPWDGRAEPHRRSMAVTRATSRAFRQQYSWIMALAGYEPTPAEEMPRDEPQRPVSPLRPDSPPPEPHETAPDGLIGTGAIQGTQDFELRMRPEGGYTLPFRVKEGRSSVICMAAGPLALSLHALRDGILGKRITVWGTYKPESFRKGDTDVNYEVLHVERVKGEDFDVPAQIAVGQEPMFSPEEQAELDKALTTT